jgi:hypothetical protein
LSSPRNLLSKKTGITEKRREAFSPGGKGKHQTQKLVAVLSLDKIILQDIIESFKDCRYSGNRSTSKCRVSNQIFSNLQETPTMPAGRIVSAVSRQED